MHVALDVAPVALYMIIHTESRYTQTYNRVWRHIRERWIQSYAYIRHSTSGLVACLLDNNTKYLLAHQCIQQRTAHTQTTSIYNSYKIHIWVAVVVASRCGGYVPTVFACSAIRAYSTWCCSRCTIHKIQIESRYTHTYNRVLRHIRERWIQSYTYIRHDTSKWVSSLLGNNTKYLLAHTCIQ